MSLLNNTYAALYSTLAAGTALIAQLPDGTASIYRQDVPPGSAFPYVVYNHQGGGPELITSKGIEGNVYLIRAYSTTSAQQAGAVFALANALLDKKNLAISGVLTFWAARETNVEMMEMSLNNTRIWMQGGLFRIRTTGN